MEITPGMSPGRIIAAAALAIALSVSSVTYTAQGEITQAAPKPSARVTNGALPISQQNGLVQKYCVVCHDDMHSNGGLSLQNFDAARVEPSLAAMMVSKLKANAMSAAGLVLPDKATQEGLFSALKAKSAGAEKWTLTRVQDPATRAPVLTASILREATSTAELYRLKLTCRPRTLEGEIQLTWSPNPADFGRAMSVAADGGTAVIYKIDSHEKMGTSGIEVTSGSAAIMLHTTHFSSTAKPNLPTPLPARTLAISNLFPNETVVFPFDRMSPTMRQQLSTCFATSNTSR